MSQLIGRKRPLPFAAMGLILPKRGNIGRPNCPNSFEKCLQCSASQCTSTSEDRVNEEPQDVHVGDDHDHDDDGHHEEHGNVPDDDFVHDDDSDVNNEDENDSDDGHEDVEHDDDVDDDDDDNNDEDSAHIDEEAHTVYVNFFTYKCLRFYLNFNFFHHFKS